MLQDTQPAPTPAAAARHAWREFRVGHPGERLGLLRQIRDGNVPVLLSGPAGQAVGSSLWSLDDSRQRLNFNIPSELPHLAAMIEANEVVAVAYLDSVKLQFDLHELVLVRGPGGATLQAAWPTEIYRFQRRSAYRVPTPERSAPTAHLRHPALPDMLLALRVIDVSIGGCALFVGHDVPPLTPGTRLACVRIELDAQTQFETGLSLQHVTAIQPEHSGVRIGCEWIALPRAAEHVLQHYIDQTQKRRRLLSLD